MPAHITKQAGPDTPSQTYKNNIRKWTLNRIIDNGNILLANNWKQHLYYPEKANKQKAAKNRQEDFINGASLLPALSRTLDHSVGSVLRKPTQFNLQPDIAFIEDNIDGTGKSAEQMIKEALAENILQGYGGFLADFANNDKVLSKAQAKQKNIRSIVQLYKPEHIISVKTERINNVVKVVQVVLQETYTSSKGQFEDEQKIQYRVLVLDDNTYIQQLWRQDNKTGDYVIYDIIPVKDANGKALEYIPFVFFGSESNDHKVDRSPMHGIALMNAKHLEYSAIRNESIRYFQPVLHVDPGASFNHEDFKEEHPEGIQWGTPSVLVFSSGSRMEVIQGEVNDAASAEMENLKNMMIESGASLIQPSVSNISHDTVKLQKSADTSVLGTATRNIEDAFNQVLQIVHQLEGVSGESRIDINREFLNASMTAQDRAQWASDAMTGFVTVQEYREAMNRADILPDSAVDNEFIDMQPVIEDEPEQDDGNE